MPTAPRILVIVPTYDEIGSLPVIIGRLRAALPAADILVMDDNSPDGTGELADRLAAADTHVQVRHRPGKGGLGPAYIDGFGIGISALYDVLVQIDADGSHPPEVLPEMVARLWNDETVDLVIGSRWVRGGSVVDWPLRREVLSRGANIYANLALGIRVKDATAGFRVYRASALSALDLSEVESKGYCFQIDMTIRIRDSGANIVEVPIEFRERQIGQSKMSGSIVAEAMRMVTVWGIGRRFRQLTGRRPALPTRAR